MDCDLLWRWLVIVWTPLLVGYYTSPFRNGSWDFIISWDDSINYIDNYMIQEDISIETIIKMMQAVRINVYEPLSWITKAIELHLFGMNSYYIRIVSLCIHLCNGIMLYHVSRKLLLQLQIIEPLGCLVGALLYTFHPIQVEIVGWPSAQPYAFSMFFALISLGSYLNYMEKSKTIYLLLSIGFYACSVLSKSISIFLPVGLCLMDYIHEPKQFHFSQLPRYIFKQCGFLLIGGLLVSAMLLANTEGNRAQADLIALTPHRRFLKAIVVFMWPIRMFLWPTELRFYYEFPVHLDYSDVDVMMSLLSMFCITLGCLALPNHSVLTAWIYYLVMLLPVCGIVQHGLVFLAADRYVYFPSIVVVPLVEVVFASFRDLSTKLFSAAILSFWIFCLCHVSVLQLESWRNEETLYRHGLHQEPTDWRILERLGDVLLRTNRVDDAKIILTRSLEYMPQDGLKSKLLRAKTMMLLLRTHESCAIYEELLQLHPTQSHVLNNIGICRWKEGRLKAARNYFVLAANGSGLTRGDMSPLANIELVDAWDPLSPIQARVMW